MKRIRVIWKSNKKGSNDGYLWLSQRIGGKTKIKSLNLQPLHKRHFNPKTQRVRETFKDFELINSQIEKNLRDIGLVGNKIELMSDNKKSFIEFMDSIIKQTTNQGTILKYVNIKNLLLMFNKKTYGTDDIKFSDIDVDFIKQFRHWLIMDRKNLQNSAIHKIKSFKAFISKAKKEGKYVYSQDPFLNITHLKEPSTKKDTLSIEEMQKLMSTELKEVYRNNKNKEKFGKVIEDKDYYKKYKLKIKLTDYRNFFLFQLLANGIRVSDVMTLRWGHFKVYGDEIRFTKDMFKTKLAIDVLINFQTARILINYLPKDLEFTENEIKTLENVKKLDNHISKTIKDDLEVQNIKIKFSTDPKFFKSEPDGVSVKMLTNRIKQLEFDIKDKSKLIKNPEYKYINGILKEVEEYAKKEVQKNEKVLFAPDEQIYDILKKYIPKLSSNYKYNFVFPLLDDKMFEDVKLDKKFEALSRKQYDRFTGARGYYNFNLKLIASQCDIKQLNSHMARHTYTSLLMDIKKDINIYDLMRALGHKNVTTTQKYIKDFKSTRVDDLGKQLADYLKT